MTQPREENLSENTSQEEVSDWNNLGTLFDENRNPSWEKLQNFPVYIRRQEISYLIAYYDIFKQVLNVKGSILYFGVYCGAGFMTHAHLSAALEPFNHTRRIIGFDTFEGYPEID